jgi:hypothetical protein
MLSILGCWAKQGRARKRMRSKTGIFVCILGILSRINDANIMLFERETMQGMGE